MALSRADCKFPPELTVIVVPGAGLFAIADGMKVRGNSAGPSNPPVAAEETVKLKAALALLPFASVTLAVKGNDPETVVVPEITPFDPFS